MLVSFALLIDLVPYVVSYPMVFVLLRLLRYYIKEQDLSILIVKYLIQGFVRMLVENKSAIGYYISEL